MDIIKGRLQAMEPGSGDYEPLSENNIRVPGQRDPDRTKRAILEAATAEFVCKGFAGASVNEIAARANVNKRMLYHYFGKKDELYIAVIEKIYATLRAAQAQLNLAGLPPLKAIERLILFTWDYYLKHPELLSIMSAENMQNAKYVTRSSQISNFNAPLMNALQDVLDRGVKEGVFRADIDPVQVYLSIAGLSSFYVITRLSLSAIFARDLASEEALATRAEHVVDVVQRYLRP
ncbi:MULTISPECIES: TetR/AcrR family transcriptional regulator [Rhodomicrobium]|uniref:TetR/AcrR family transcriptional regulator n=1 Tax=Rhodomicrobium TaxID=1068 RepID=UPI001483C921|nr:MULTISPECIES: TetR/AcrR family transcriptional regulator [Rhodomicrobium]